MPLPIIATTAAKVVGKAAAKKAVKAGATVGKKVAKKAVKAGAEKVKKKAKMKVSKLSEMVNEKVQDKLGVDDGEIKKRRGRPRKFKTVEEVKADIDARELKKVQEKLKKEKEKNKKAKIQPSKLVAPPESGLMQLEERVKVNSEKITIIKNIQKIHRTNHQKEKGELAEINNVLSGIADFIKADYESRIDAADKENNQMMEDASKEDQKNKEKGLEKTGKKTGDKIGKISQGIISPVKGVFDRLMDAVTAIGLGIVGNAAFKFLARPEIFEKLSGVFDFISEHILWITGALGAIALIGIIGPIVAIGSAIGTVIGAVAGAAVIVAKIALVIGGIILAIKGATDIFKWLRGDKLGDDIVSDSRKDNREQMKEEGVEKAHISGIFGERYRVERDGEMVKLKYKELTPDEQAIVDQFKARDQEIKDAVKDRKKEKADAKKRIKGEREGSQEYADIKAMPRGKERGKIKGAFDKETNRLVKEEHDAIDKKYDEVFTQERKIGGDASGLTLVGENGPEIVDFKTAVNVVPAHRTQETLKTLGDSGGTNVITMDLPPITSPAPEVNVGTPASTEVERIPSVNPFNSYMVMTPQILRIS
ncbi:MAG: hypothetical protein CMN34_07250 [Saprospirales bacterium]|nr:hypothetical protein [Saprospirales bacterium]|tara:strand:- start:2268 stop:4046 length:1779 start_codon:yes stop_codon:yes gene_type:complete